MDTYVEGWVGDVLRTVSQVMEEAGVEFFIVGAIARDLWLDELGAAPGRATRDLDLALYVKSIEQFEAVRQQLADHPGHSIVSGNPLRIAAGNRYEIDLLPFADWDEYSEGSTIATLVGVDVDLCAFSESYKSGTVLREVADRKYAALSIPAFILAKLMAIDARPEERLGKDLGDILSVMDAYEAFETAYILEHSDDLWGGEGGFEEVAGLNLGRRVGRLAVPNQHLRKVIGEVLGLLKSIPPRTRTGTN